MHKLGSFCYCKNRQDCPIAIGGESLFKVGGQEWGFEAVPQLGPGAKPLVGVWGAKPTEADDTF